MSEKYTMEGQIKLIGDVQTFKNDFTKREFVIETDGKYPQMVKFEVVKDGCQAMDEFNVGERVVVSFNIRGNEWNEKYYVNLQAWNVEHQAGTQTIPQAQAEAEQAMDDSDPLPF